MFPFITLHPYPYQTHHPPSKSKTPSPIPNPSLSPTLRNRSLNTLAKQYQIRLNNIPLQVQNRETITLHRSSSAFRTPGSQSAYPPYLAGTQGTPIFHVVREISIRVPAWHAYGGLELTCHVTAPNIHIGSRILQYMRKSNSILIEWLKIHDLSQPSLESNSEDLLAHALMR